VDQILDPQLELFQAHNPNGIAPSAPLLDLQQRVDALMLLHQPVQTGVHTSSPLVQTEVRSETRRRYWGRLDRPSNAPDHPMRSDITNA
jgi:hypothetical protein